MKYDEYKNLVHEFYSSLNLTMDEKDNILDYTMKFKLCGETSYSHSRKLIEWLECDYEGMLNTSTNFNQFDS